MVVVYAISVFFIRVAGVRESEPTYKALFARLKTVTEEELKDVCTVETGRCCRARADNLEP